MEKITLNESQKAIGEEQVFRIGCFNLCKISGDE